MKDTPKPGNRHPYDAAFRAEALRLAAQSRSTHVAARALHTDPKRLYQWQKAVQTPVAAALGAALDPATAAELRQLWVLARRQAQGLEVLKNAIARCLLGAQALAGTGPMSRSRFLAAGQTGQQRAVGGGVKRRPGKRRW